MNEVEIATEKQPYLPKIWPAVVLLLGYAFVMFVPAVIIRIFYDIFGFSADMLIDALSSMATLAILIYWINRKKTLNLDPLLDKKLPIGFYLAAIPLTVGTTIILSDIDNLLRFFLPMNDFWREAFASLTGGNDAMWKAFIAVSIVAPVVEEVLFRGIILPGFLTHYSRKKAILVSALLFALVHANPWQFTPAFVAGLITAYLFVRTGSLLLCIFVHALNNSLGFIVRLIGLNIPGFTSGLTQVEFQPWWFNLLGIALLAAGVALMKKQLEIQPQNLPS